VAALALISLPYDREVHTSKRSMVQHRVHAPGHNSILLPLET
jgi:hypothetical protein